MKIIVSGTGVTRFGELWDMGALELANRASEEALREAGISLSDVDLLVVGNMLLSRLENQAHVGAYVASGIGYLGPAMAVEAACASGGLAIRQAVAQLRSGMAKRVLVVGLEKMTDVPTEEVAMGLMGAASDDERWVGATFPGLYGMMHRAYQQKYGVADELMGWSVVKNHYHGTLNPLAHFQKAITVNDVLNSQMVADPMRLLHCSPISDGAAAVVLEARKTLHKDQVELVGSGQGGDVMGFSERKTLTSLTATKKAMKEVVEETGILLDQVEVVELHDCFGVAEMMAIEDMGLAPQGKSGDLLKDGLGSIDGDGVVINSSGGLKAAGHPVGATGVKQVVEVVRQLRGVLGKRQVKDVRLGLTHNVGGTGATAVIHIFRRTT